MPEHPHKPSNSCDFHPVCIVFEDPSINEIFSQLLEVRGIPTKILRDIKELSGESKVITEVQYFSDLDARYLDKCLIVGNKHALKDIKALSLTQPLTEEKIETALSHFLKA